MMMMTLYYFRINIMCGQIFTLHIKSNIKVPCLICMSNKVSFINHEERHLECGQLNLRPNDR